MMYIMFCVSITYIKIDLDNYKNTTKQIKYILFLKTKMFWSETEPVWIGFGGKRWDILIDRKKLNLFPSWKRMCKYKNGFFCDSSIAKLGGKRTTGWEIELE